MEKDFYKKDVINSTDGKTDTREKNSKTHFINKNLTDKTDELWRVISVQIRKDIGETAWRNWIKPLVFETLETEIIHLNSPSKLVRDRVKSHYADKLRLVAKTFINTSSV